MILSNFVLGCFLLCYLFTILSSFSSSDFFFGRVSDQYCLQSPPLILKAEECFISLNLVPSSRRQHLAEVGLEESETEKMLFRVVVRIECFQSRGQHLCKFIGTKEIVCIRKEFNSQRIGLGHQHGGRDVM